MALDLKYPTDIFRNPKRSGQFRDYDSLRLYYVGYGGYRNTQTRFRRYNGLGERPPLPQHDLNRSEFMIIPNKPHRIQIVAIGNRTQYIRNAEVIFDFQDDIPNQTGWFAFRTVRNHMTATNFKFTRAIPGPGVDTHPPLLRLGGPIRKAQISTGRSPAMHAYRGICPVSPDATKISYFEFERAIPGWGRVVVANRDGSDPRYISERIKGHYHDGARQQWIDNDHVIYGMEDEEKSLIYRLSNKSTREVADPARQGSEVGQHTMRHAESSQLSDVRRNGFEHCGKPYALDLLGHPIDGSRGKPIVSEAFGIHGSLSPDGKYLATGIFDWPEPNTHAVLLHDIASGDYRVLARMKAEPIDPKHEMHPTPPSQEMAIVFTLMLRLMEGDASAPSTSPVSSFATLLVGDTMGAIANRPRKRIIAV